MGRVEVWARPGSRDTRVEWDEWRNRWVISCHEPPSGGRANEAILRLLAERLGVARAGLRYVTVGKRRDKLVEVDGLSDSEIAVKLRQDEAPS